MKVILTEKPSVARDIADHLGAKQRHDGYFEGNGYQVTWAFGHLIALKNPEDYDPALKKWSIATIPFIPNPFELKVVEDKGISKQFAIIKKLLKSSSEIICATDAGREGELIFRYIVSMVQCENKPWKRLWLSSLTDEAIHSAFQNLKPGSDYNNLYAAARCRSESDWIVGLNATRNLTVRYGGAARTLWSVGRVQTPVLAMIVKRDDEIRHFKSEPFWELLTKYRDVIFKHKAGRYKQKAEAEDVLTKVKDKPFVIEKIAVKKENEYPPLLYDLTELQRDMNRRFGMSAADTLQIAQTLYEQKLITYPRTDSRYLTNDLKGQVVKTLESLKPVKNTEIAQLNLSQLPFSNRIINDKKVTDHHAIIPTGKLPNVLPFQSQFVFEAVLTRLIAVFYPTCIKELTTIDGVANKELFQAKGIRVIIAGWTALYPKKSDENKEAKQASESQELPQFVMGENGPHFPYINEGKTNPPAHYNENALLGAMETAGKLVEDEALKEALKEKGIGTPATRASIIETLLKRNYIQRTGKSLIATDLGRYLIALIQDPNLKSPELTGEWESKLKEIEQGKYSAIEFMQKIAGFIKQVIVDSDITKINFEAYGSCPKCKNAIIKGNKGYGCSKWLEGCKFVLWRAYKDMELNEGQIRSLLQKKILLQPIQGNILSLSDAGELTEIPAITNQAPQWEKKAARSPRRYPIKK
ncbi:MAG TPA: DNA topoisomerase 3 [Parachlamydiaceae bacterium]|nr:DNA topoisomerase 3 [Parachlamydiaceae bacterium]